MGLIQYVNMEDGNPASVNGLNERFGLIINELNGNLDSVNYKNESIIESKLAPGAVSSSKIKESAVLPSHMGNVWVGPSAGRAAVDTSWYSVFNKTITFQEAAYIYVLWTASGNANKAGDPGVQILVNDNVLDSMTGVSGLELYDSALNKDFPFALSAITQNKYSGNVNIKVQVKHTASDGWDVGSGFVRIDALSDGSRLV